MEVLVKAIAKEFSGEELTLPLPRLDYHESMERFGNDRPDLRYGLELQDLADIASKPSSRSSRPRPSSGNRVRGLCARARPRNTAARTSTRSPRK